MNHEFYTDRLSAYFDQELKNEEFVIIDEHVKQCAECQQLLTEYARLDETINRHAGLDDTDYWEKSAQKIETAIGGKQDTEILPLPKSSYQGLWWKISGLAASIAILAFISLYEKDITNDLDRQLSPAPENKIIQPADSVTSGESQELYRQTRTAEESALTDNLAAKEEKTDQPVLTDITDADASVKKQTISKTDFEPDIIKPKEKDDIRSSFADKPDKGAALPQETESAATTGKTTIEEPFGERKKTKTVTQNLNEAIDLSLSPKSAPTKLHSAESKPSTAAGAAIESLTEADENMLGYWQNTVVTNQIVLDNQKKQTIAYKKSIVKDKEQQVLNIRDEKELYTGIFEGYYNIALLTNDSTEREEAIANLKKYARDLGFDYSADANNFLYKYDSVQSVLNRLQEKK